MFQCETYHDIVFEWALKVYTNYWANFQVIENIPASRIRNAFHGSIVVLTLDAFHFLPASVAEWVTIKTNESPFSEEILKVFFIFCVKHKK